MPDKSSDNFPAAVAAAAIESGKVALDVLAGFASAIDRAPIVAIQSLDREGIVRVWNDASAALFGIAREDALAKPLPDLLRYDDVDHVQFHVMLRHLWDSGQSGTPRDCRVVTAHGKSLWIYTVMFPVMRHGKTRQVFAMAVDVTARKAAEQLLSASADEFSAFFERSADAIILLQERQFHRFNAAALRLFGFTDKGDMEGMRPESLSPPFQPDGRSSPEKMAEMTTLALLNGNHRFEWLYCTRDGREFWGEALLTAMPPGPGGETLYAVVRDITGRKAAEQALRLSARVFENSREGILILDSDYRIASVNAAFCAMTGFSESHVVGADAAILKSMQSEQAHYDAIWREVRRSDHWQGEIWGQRSNGESFPAWASISAVRDGSRLPSNYIIMFFDISERKAAEEKIRHMVEHDFLTGLPNRVLLLDRLQQAMASARRNGTQVAVLFLDLDRFKNVNDTLGHHVGDKLLQAVAERLKSCVRGVDTVSRQGGDEFIIMLADIGDAAQVAHIADNILLAISQPYRIEKHELGITTCIGIGIYPNDGDDIDTLVRHADIAMYHAKESGRNGYQFFNSEMNVRIVERLNLEIDMKKALARHEFLLQYQPEMDIVSGRVVGAEALLRWQHPQAGLLLPHQFLDIAEECGLIVPIGEWVLRCACSQARAWQDAGLEMTVAVNMSQQQLRQKDLVQSISTALELADLDPQYLEIEIAENVLMERSEAVIETIQVLRRMGVRLAIDHFGSGHSSLASLRRFAIDKLKIDQSFLHGLHSDNGDAAIVRAILLMAKSMKMKVIAEGVETNDQLAFLEEQGCDEYQGHYLARPARASEMLRFRPM